MESQYRIAQLAILKIHPFEADDTVGSMEPLVHSLHTLDAVATYFRQSWHLQISRIAFDETIEPPARLCRTTLLDPRVRIIGKHRNHPIVFQEPDFSCATKV